MMLAPPNAGTREQEKIINYGNDNMKMMTLVTKMKIISMIMTMMVVMVVMVKMYLLLPESSQDKRPELDRCPSPRLLCGMHFLTRLNLQNTFLVYISPSPENISL